MLSSCNTPYYIPPYNTPYYTCKRPYYTCNTPYYTCNMPYSICNRPLSCYYYVARQITCALHTTYASLEPGINCHPLQPQTTCNHPPTTPALYTQVGCQKGLHVLYYCTYIHSDSLHAAKLSSTSKSQHM